MRFHTTAHIRWDDLDAFGHVNNATYLTYAQEARSRFLWFSRKEQQQEPVVVDIVVARAEVDFILPIYQGGFDCDVAIWVTRVGNSSFELEYEISTAEGLHARLKTVQVAIDQETKRSKPLTELDRQYLNSYLEPAL